MPALLEKALESLADLARRYWLHLSSNRPLQLTTRAGGYRLSSRA
jgi:hypothetical protein